MLPARMEKSPAPPPRAECRYFGTLPELGADAAHPFWENIAPMPLRENVTGGEPEQGTWVKLAHNAQDWRVLFHAEDTDAWATLTARDALLYTEETVEIFVDPVGDLASYFELEINPLNAVCDLMLRRTRSGLRKEFAWHCAGLRSTVRKTDTAWISELAIPFSSVSVDAPPAAGAVWRVNFLRIDRPRHRERELSAWSPTFRPNFHIPERFGFLEFVGI